MQRWKAVCLILLLVAISTASAAENWPKWRGPRGDNIAKGDGLAQAWPEGGPKEIWRVNVGAGYSSPVVVDGVLYMFGQEGKTDALVALSADDRREVWRKAYPTKFKDKFPGTRATPTVVGDRIYTTGGNGDVTCWKRADGGIVWTVNVLAKTGSKKITWGSASSPLVMGDSLYVQCGQNGPTAVALNAANGEIRWQSEARSLAGYSTIAPAKVGGSDMLLVFGGVEIIAMDPKTGKTLWAEPYETQYKVNATTPIVRKDQAFITHGYKAAKGTLLQIKPTGVAKIWENKVIRARFVTPIPEGDVMYANSKGVIKCVTWATGEEVWAVDDKALNIGVGGSMTRAGKLLIVLSETGTLSLVHATPAGWEKRGQMKLFQEKNTWSTPLVYNGRLYVKSNNQLVCLDISEPAAE